MHESVMAFGRSVLNPTLIQGKGVLEVGSMDVNGSLRGYVDGMEPTRYVGVDFQEGRGVDIVCDAGNLVDRFGVNSFDVVISTEMLEHAEDWRGAVSAMKRVLREDGVILLTARGPGFMLHGYPHDWHRFTVADFNKIFADFEILRLESDPQASGVLLMARKPQAWIENSLSGIGVAAADAINAPRPSERREGGTDQAAVDVFTKVYYGSPQRTWQNTFWMGVPLSKFPTDLWIYQEILHELRPDLIIECGTYRGGSALYFAGLCDLLGRGEIVTVDVTVYPARPVHPRIQYLTGSSTDPAIVQQIRERAAHAEVVLVILDSDHRAQHVLDECRAYREIVTPGSYLIVEDTCVNGNPLLPDFGPGPMEAVDAFLREATEYSIDRGREKLYLTTNPRGYLRKQSRAFQAVPGAPRRSTSGAAQRPVLSLMHPTRERPDLCLATSRRWAESVRGTGIEIEYLVAIDAEDAEAYADYIRLAKEEAWFDGNHRTVIMDGVRLISDADGTIANMPANGDDLSSFLTAVNKVNRLAEHATGQWLFFIADDFAPTADDWLPALKMMLDQWDPKWNRILVAPEAPGRQLVNHPIMSRAFYRYQGYFFCPEYLHVCVDCDLYQVAVFERALHQVPPGIYDKFRHKNPYLTTDGQWDKVYAVANNVALYEQGRRVLAARKEQLAKIYAGDAPLGVTFEHVAEK